MKNMLVLSVLCLAGCTKSEGANNPKVNPVKQANMPQAQFDERNIENAGAWIDGVLTRELGKTNIENPLVRKEAVNRINAVFAEHVGKHVTWEFEVRFFSQLDDGVMTVDLEPSTIGEMQFHVFLPRIQAATHGKSESNTFMLERGLVIELSDDFFKRLAKGDKLTINATIEKFTATGLHLKNGTVVQP